MSKRKTVRECRKCKTMTDEFEKHQVRVDITGGSRGVDLTYTGYYCPTCVEELRAGIVSARKTRLSLVV